MKNKPQRCWINQPSTLQPLHHLHGKCVLAVDDTNKMKTIYFLDGEIVSARVPANVLSLGWKYE